MHDTMVKFMMAAEMIEMNMSRDGHDLRGGKVQLWFLHHAIRLAQCGSSLLRNIACALPGEYP